MATNTYVALDLKTVTSAISSVTFTSIPSTYTDLQLVVSGTVASNSYLTIRFNNDTTSTYTHTEMGGDGTSAYSVLQSSDVYGYTSSIYTSQSQTVYDIFNYANSTTFKTFLSKNSSSSGVKISAGLWRATPAAINRIDIGTAGGPNFTVGTTFALYGILAENVSAAKATGGTVYADSTYWYHVFGASGTFTPSQTITCDTLVVGGGGGGGWNNGGGGGGAEVVINTGSSYTSGSAKTVTIGAGGVSGTSTTSYTTNGGNSSVSTITTALGGGAGGHGDASDTSKRSGQTGGSGGGGCLGYNGGSPSGSNTFAGGNSYGAADNYQGGGGGGATAVGTAGANAVAGSGGQGYAMANIFSGLALSGITHVGSGGGGGGSLLNTATPMRRGIGGTGAGDGAMQNTTSGNFNPGNGSANTGGGAGGGAYTGVNSRQGGTGGSGLVIIRYLK
jgi:hypothetical protein